MSSEKGGEDLTGRKRIWKNVVASWVGHTVFVAAGFVLPRLIDRHVGQAGLGVWDFGWSLVSYFELAQAGIGSSTNSYVAGRRAAGDVEGLNRTVSSTQLIQTASAALVLLLTTIAVLLVPTLFSDRFADHGNETQWVIGLLGAALAIQLFTNVYAGVISGCHRWDIHNGINSAFHGATVLSMIACLTLGGGLRALATASFLGTLASEITRVIAAHRVCPELRVHYRLATLAEARKVLGFGGRTLMGGLSRVLLYQTNNMLIVAYFGAATLAMYARPMALLRHTQTLVDKFSFVLVPTASSLHTTGKKDELRELILRMGRYGAHLALPMVLFIGILGNPVLRLWMGPQYEQGIVVAILALGHMFALTQQPLYNMLIGLDMHGVPGFARFLGSIAAVGIGWTCMGPLGLGLPGAAIALAIPLACVHGLFVPLYACRRLEIPYRSYLRETLAEPLLCAAPLAASLVAVRLALPDRPVAAIAAGMGCCAVLGAVLAWRYVIPALVRRQVVRKESLPSPLARAIS